MILLFFHASSPTYAHEHNLGGQPWKYFEENAKKSENSRWPPQIYCI